MIGPQEQPGVEPAGGDGGEPGPLRAGHVVRRVPSVVELAAAHRAVGVRIARMSFVVLVFTVVLVSILGGGREGSTLAANPWQRWIITGSTAVVVVVAFLAFDLLTPRKRIGVLTGVFFGALAGVFAAWLMSLVIDLFVTTYLEEAETVKAAQNTVTTIKVLIGIGLAYMGITTVLQTQDDYRLVIPYVEFAKQIRGPRPLLLDTSALIDARIVDLAATGVVQTPMVVPRFVLIELQTLSDSVDRMNRTKGRRGLDAVARMQRTAGIDITVDETPIPGKSVDQMLVELARLMPAVVVTTDANLNRVATIQNVTVLNLNDVANALKPSLIPGSQMVIAVIRAGEQPGQGVGYLDDGTMVVVEGGGSAVGSEARVEVTSAMQTSAGRLIFARNLDTSETRPPLPVGEPEGVPEIAAAEQEPAGEPTIGEPLAVRPPSKPLRTGPIGPAQFGKAPNRNPRRG
ncbi:MAG TPA: TRAM domain-containing protein [Phycisphaerales bacterium]|nr:TRAM domain-containing protein [Phycisphaerales bacterium]